MIAYVLDLLAQQSVSHVDWNWTTMHRVSITLPDNCFHNFVLYCGSTTTRSLVNGSKLFWQISESENKSTTFIVAFGYHFKSLNDVGITELFSVVHKSLLGQNYQSFTIQYLVVLLMHIQVTAQFRFVNNRKWFIRSISFLNKLAANINIRARALLR